MEFPLIHTPNATIIISNSDQSHIELSVAGDVSVSTTILGNAGANFLVKAETGNILKLLSAQNITPFFKLSKLSANPWRVFTALNITASLNGLSNILDPMSYITPQLAKNNPAIANALFLENI